MTGGDEGKWWRREVVTMGSGDDGKWWGREVVTMGSGAGAGNLVKKVFDDKGEPVRKGPRGAEGLRLRSFGSFYVFCNNGLPVCVVLCVSWSCGCRSHWNGCMNVAWALFWGGSRSTKPCVFPCKVAAAGDERYLVCAAVAAAVVWFLLCVLQQWWFLCV